MTLELTRRGLPNQAALLSAEHKLVSGLEWCLATLTFCHELKCDFARKSWPRSEVRREREKSCSKNMKANTTSKKHLFIHHTLANVALPFVAHIINAKLSHFQRGSTRVSAAKTNPKDGCFLSSLTPKATFQYMMKRRDGGGRGWCVDIESTLKAAHLFRQSSIVAHFRESPIFF